MQEDQEIHKATQMEWKRYVSTWLILTRKYGTILVDEQNDELHNFHEQDGMVQLIQLDEEKINKAESLCLGVWRKKWRQQWASRL